MKKAKGGPEGDADEDDDEDDDPPAPGLVSGGQRALASKMLINFVVIFFQGLLLKMFLDS